MSSICALTASDQRLTCSRPRLPLLTSALSVALPSLVSRLIHSSSAVRSGIFTPRAWTWRRAPSNRMDLARAGKRFAPRVFEYKLTNSQTSRAYLLTACNSKCLMNMGVKHSLCLISMLSKMQPSESMPTNNSFEGLKSRRICAGSLIVCAEESRRLNPHGVKHDLLAILHADASDHSHEGRRWSRKARVLTCPQNIPPQ